MEFTIPEIGKTHVVAVYKITVDDKWFYIGSSKNLRMRFSKWKTAIKTGNRSAITFKNVVKPKSVLKFEIIKIVDEGTHMWHENRILSEVYESDFCLNRSPTAFSPYNCRAPIGETPYPPKEPVKQVCGYIPKSTVCEIEKIKISENMPSIAKTISLLLKEAVEARIKNRNTEP